MPASATVRHDALRVAIRGDLMRVARETGAPDGYAPSIVVYRERGRYGEVKVRATVGGWTVDDRGALAARLTWSQAVRRLGLRPYHRAQEVSDADLIHDLRRVALLCGREPNEMPGVEEYREQHALAYRPMAQVRACGRLHAAGAGPAAAGGNHTPTPPRRCAVKIIIGETELGAEYAHELKLAVNNRVAELKKARKKVEDEGLFMAVREIDDRLLLLRGGDGVVGLAQYLDDQIDAFEEQTGQLRLDEAQTAGTQSIEEALEGHEEEAAKRTSCPHENVLAQEDNGPMVCEDCGEQLPEPDDEEIQANLDNESEGAEARDGWSEDEAHTIQTSAAYFFKDNEQAQAEFQRGARDVIAGTLEQDASTAYHRGHGLGQVLLAKRPEKAQERKPLTDFPEVTPTLLSILHRQDITTVEDVARRWDDLPEIRGVGQTSLQVLADVVEQHTGAAPDPEQEAMPV